jgi:hypothetical protein
MPETLVRTAPEEAAATHAAGETVLTPSDLPDPSDLPELRIISRSTIFYWWPVWVAGYFMALITAIGGERLTLANGTQILIHPNTGLGLAFVVILTLIMVFTNVKLRGIYSVVFLLSIAFMTVLFGWMGWWDRIFSLIPQLTVFMNIGFYLTFSSILFVIWLLRFFIFDRLVYWKLRPGQLTTEHVVGGGQQSYDTRGMLFEQRSDDFFRHKVLGLGSGDIRLITTGAKKEEIEIPNVLFAGRKVRIMQRLIAVKPEEALARTVGVRSR